MSGASSVRYGAIPLPWDLGSVGAARLPAAVAFGSAGAGGLVQAATMPPGLVGSAFHAQWVVANPPASADVASLTRALSTTIQ